MTELPEALAPWAAQFAALQEDVALALAPWVGRLALAVGSLAAVHTGRTGEPDGYGGLARRGSYERLVAGEWGVAELFPDEFLRRAAAGEHLFLDLARRAPRAARASVAIVSAGPAQLGSPRLAHLAALIVLARRANAAGAGFSWGILEDRAHQLTGQLDAAAIRRLLAARTAVAAEHGALAAWLTAVGRGPSGDVWFIGAEQDAAVARRAGAACLVVRDLLEPHGRALEVEIERRGPRARLRLELPAPELCARLLRDPFRAGAGARTASAAGPARAVRFAPGGQRLLVELAGGAAESWPIPNSPRAGVGQARRWTPPRDRVVVALGVGRRSVLAVTATRDDPAVVELGTGDSHRIRVTLLARAAEVLQARLTEGAGVPIGTCGLVSLRAGAPAELVVEIAGHLVIVNARLTPWPPPDTELTAHSLQAGNSAQLPTAIATAFRRASVVWAERRDEPATGTATARGAIRIVEASASGNRPLTALDASAAPAVQLGFAWPPESSGWGVVAVALDDEHWTVAAEKLAPVIMRSVDPVVGVRLQDNAPALLTQPEPHRLCWLERDRRELLPPSATPIMAAAVCPVLPRLAWVTEAGEVVVYSMLHKAIVMRRVPEVAP